MKFVLVLLTVAAAAASPGKPSFRHEHSTADAEVALTIEQRIGRWPELHARLWRQDIAELRRFAAEAKGPRAELRKEGMKPPQFSKELSWEVSAAAPRLVSLIGAWYDFSGGAHPNHGYRTLLWDVAAKREVKPPELFKPPSPTDAQVDRALCEGMEKARREKGVEADGGHREMWPCPKFRKAKFALLASSRTGAFGGFQFLFDPYEIGPYAEGEYEVLLPQAVMRPVLAPTWAVAFAGQPQRPERKD